MNSKTLSVLALVTVVLLVAAVVAYSMRATSISSGEDRERLFPDLADHVNDVAALAVSTSEERFRIEKAEGGWQLAGRGGYPVEFEKVKAAIVGLSNLEIVEPKTSKPELYTRLGVEGPGEADSGSMLVTLEDGEGRGLASLIIGDQSTGGGGERRFVRREGEAPSWLVHGAMQVAAKPMDWIDRNIVGIPRDRIQSIEIDHPDGETLFVYRDTKEQTSFAVSDVPPDRELTFPGVASSIGNALAFLRIEDVARADARPLDPDDTTVATFKTFDGLVVTARTDETDEQVWATFEVSVPEPPAAPADEAREAATAGGGEAAATEADGEAADEQEADEPGVEEEADSLRARLDGWVFRLGDTQAEAFRKRLLDLTKERPVEEPEETPDLQEGGAGAPPPAGGIEMPPPAEGEDGAEATGSAEAGTTSPGSEAGPPPRP